MSEPNEVPRVTGKTLRAFASRALGAAGLDAEGAATAADLIVEADERGSDTHGIIRLPRYVERVRAGGINPRPNIRVISERASAALVDGNNGMGHLVMRHAAQVAIEKAAASGAAWVGARMSNHAGPASLYATMPLPHDMIGIYFAVGSSNHLPPWGGSEMLLGTNPVAIAVPAMEEAPVVLDMAPTVAAYGKVRLKQQRGEPMPVGWMIDRQGKPLTDAARADEGYLLPIGEYKGYGLALMIGMLAGLLNRAAFGRDLVDFAKDPKAVTNTGHAILALRIDTFAPALDFKRSVDATIREMRTSSRLPGIERIFVPGEQSHLRMRDRIANGVPMPAPLRKSLDKWPQASTSTPCPDGEIHDE